MVVTPVQIILALEIFAYLVEKAPQVIEAFNAGKADQLDWSKIRMRSTDELRKEVDAAPQ